MLTENTIPFEWFRYREVLYNILARELKVKYKRTSLGYLWSLLNPILQMAVMAFVFSHIVRQGIRDYTQYLFSGFLAWNFFQTTVALSSTAILENENFIKKIYLPKLIFPLSRVCARSIDFVLSVVALSVIGIFAGFQYSASVVCLPLAMASVFLMTLGVAIIVSVATVFYRDVQYLIQVFLQLLYFATPIMYPIEMLPEKYRAWLSLNPFYSQVRVFQAILYDNRFPTVEEWALALATAVMFWLMGLWILKRTEDEIVFRM